VEIGCSFCRNRSNLLIAPSVSWNKKNGYSFDLDSKNQYWDSLHFCDPTFVSSSTIPSLYRYTEYLLAKRVCSVSKSDNFANEGLIYDIRHPLVSNCRVKAERRIENNAAAAMNVVTRVNSEVDHGLRILERRGFCLDSGILSAVMASFEGTLTPAVSEG